MKEMAGKKNNKLVKEAIKKAMDLKNEDMAWRLQKMLGQKLSFADIEFLNHYLQEY